MIIQTQSQIPIRDIALAERKVLIVDDDVDIARLIKHYLRFDALSITHLKDPREVMAYLAIENYRVVLLDIDMPFRTGIELMTEIKRFDASIQTIMMTGTQNLSTLILTQHSGAEYLIFKPFSGPEAVHLPVRRTFRKLDHWVTMIRQFRKGARPAGLPQLEVEAPLRNLTLGS